MKKITLSILLVSFSFLNAIEVHNGFYKQKSEKNISINKISTKNFEFLLKEPKIKNIYYDKQYKKLIVQVKDDGTIRNGYAEYISIEVDMNGLQKYINSIYIKDVKIPMKVIKNGNGKYLGKWIIGVRI